jgi:hypothetical protein
MTGDVASPEAAALLARTDRPVIEKPFELAELARVIGRLAADSGVSAPESQPAAPRPPGSDRAPSG